MSKIYMLKLRLLPVQFRLHVYVDFQFRPTNKNMALGYAILPLGVNGCVNARVYGVL